MHNKYFESKHMFTSVFNLWSQPNKQKDLKPHCFRPHWCVPTFPIRTRWCSIHDLYLGEKRCWWCLAPIKLRDPCCLALYYPSSHNHGSEKWVPPILVSFQLGWSSTSMIMGERVTYLIAGPRPIFWHSIDPFSVRMENQPFEDVPSLKLTCFALENQACGKMIPSFWKNLFSGATSVLVRVTYLIKDFLSSYLFQGWPFILSKTNSILSYPANRISMTSLLGEVENQSSEGWNIIASILALRSATWRVCRSPLCDCRSQKYLETWNRAFEGSVQGHYD